MQRSCFSVCMCEFLMGVAYKEGTMTVLFEHTIST